MTHTIQIIFTILVVFAIIWTFYNNLKENDKKTYRVKGMIVGFLIGAIAGYYIFNALICGLIGMLCGLAIGKKKEKNNS